MNLVLEELNTILHKKEMMLLAKQRLPSCHTEQIRKSIQGTSKEIDDLKEAMQILIHVYANGLSGIWISVNDRLPSINQGWYADPVLVCCKWPFTDKPRVLWFCNYMQNGQWQDNEGQTFENVTHWMENPAFPDYTP